jgi:RND superfamily putative drug exporter
MTGFFPTLGDLMARYRVLVIVLWILLVVVSFFGAKDVRKSLVSGGIKVPGSESDVGRQILEDEFNRRPTRSAAILFTSDKLKVTDAEYQNAAHKMLDEVKKVEGVEEIFSVFYIPQLRRLVSADEHTTYSVVNFSGTEEEAKEHVPTVRKVLQENRPDTIEAFLIGFPATSYDLSKGSAHDLEKAELYTLPLTLFLLVTVFGTIVAAGLPVMLGVAAVMTALAGIFLVAQKMETSIFAMNTASMIGLGLGIDFSLLMVSRYREELAQGRGAHMATVRTVATAGQSIVFSGLTVMLGLSVMLLYDLVLIRSIALGMLMVAGLAVLAAVTLLPALLCLFGNKVNALNVIPGRKPGGEVSSGHGRWHSWSLTVMRYPWAFLILSVGLLVALAIPIKDMNSIGSGGPAGVGPEAESRKGFDVLTKSFPVGEVAPIQVVIKTDKRDGALDPTIKEGIWNLTDKIKADERVARVESVATLDPNLTLDRFKAIPVEQILANPQQKAAVGQYLNLDRGRDTYLLTIVSKHPDTDPNTTGLVTELREKLVPGVTQFKGTTTYVTGNTALTLDFRDKLYGQFPLLVGLVLLVTYFVLLLFFHSLLLPLKAILMNVVAIAASYGFMVMVFQWGILDDLLGFEHLGRLTMFPPVILFSILFGLSTDYEVFLLSRVKELYRKKVAEGDPNANEHSVAEGLERTAGIITAAGLLMIVVFGAFSLGDVLVIKELGVGLAVAVLIDSTIVRVIMVPASMRLMGSINWWMPKWLNWIPEISEGGELDEHPHGARQAQWVACFNCGAQLPARAKFCGRCGTGVRAAPAPVAVGAGRAMDTVWRPEYAPQPEAMPRRGDGAVAGIPANPAGIRRIPIRIQIGNVQRDAYLILRDCRVERDPSRPNVPVIAIGGLDVTPMPGQDPPEIQIRNARVRY